MRHTIKSLFVIIFLLLGGNVWASPQLPDYVNVGQGETCADSLKGGKDNKRGIIIKTINDYRIIGLLNGIEIVKEFKTKDLAVRVMTLGNSSGSAGNDNCEIAYDFFIAVSEFDESPKQNLFRISQFYNLKVEKIDTTNSLKPIIEISYGEYDNRETIGFEITIDEIFDIEEEE